MTDEGFDPDDEAFADCMWRQREGIEDEGRLDALYGRRNDDAVVEELESRLLGEQPEPVRTRVVVASDDPVARDQRRKAAPLHYIDSREIPPL